MVSRMTRAPSRLASVVIVIIVAVDIAICRIGEYAVEKDPMEFREYLSSSRYRSNYGVLKLEPGQCVYRAENNLTILSGDSKLATLWKREPVRFDTEELRYVTICGTTEYRRLSSKDKSIEVLTGKALLKLMEKYPNTFFNLQMKSRHTIKSVWGREVSSNFIVLPINVTNKYDDDSWEGEFHVESYQNHIPFEFNSVEVYRFSLCRLDLKKFQRPLCAY